MRKDLGTAAARSVALLGAAAALGAAPGCDYLFNCQNKASAWFPGRYVLVADEHRKESLPAEGLRAGDLFGAAVAFDEAFGTTGDLLAVGAPGHDEDGADDAGAVHLFSSEAQWKQIARVVSPDADDGDAFGSSLALFGDTWIVGAPGDDEGGTDAGAAYVIAKGESGWHDAAVTKLMPLSPEAHARFGSSLCFVNSSDSVVLVGAPREAVDGAVHRFERIEGRWTETGRATAARTGHGDAFGAAVAPRRDDDGDVLVGAPGVAPGYDLPGSLTAVKANSEVAPLPTGSALTSPSPLAGDSFGASIAFGFFSGGANRIAVGAPLSRLAWLGDAAGDPAWRSVPDDASAYTGFGSAVAFVDGLLAVGVAGDSTRPGEVRAIGRRADLSGADPGPDADELVALSSVTAPDAANGDGFGSSLSGGEGLLAVGAPYGARGKGAVYLLEKAQLNALLGSHKRAPTPVTNNYLALRAVDEPDRLADGSIELDRDLVAPFHWEVTIGLFDEARRSYSAGAHVGAELSVVDSSPREFVQVHATFIPEGLRLDASTHAADPNAPKYLIGAEKAVVAFDLDGSQAVVSARGIDDSAFVEVGRFPFVLAGRSLRQCARGWGLAGRAEVGWDDSLVETDAPPPASLTPSERTAEFVARAMDLQLAANAALETAFPDRETAAARLDASLGQLAAARTTSTSPVSGAGKRPPGTGPAAAAKALRRAEKFLGSAAKQLVKGKPADRVAAKVMKALAAERDARYALAN